jgi:hypothetical protein
MLSPRAGNCNGCKSQLPKEEHIGVLIFVFEGDVALQCSLDSIEHKRHRTSLHFRSGNGSGARGA